MTDSEKPKYRMLKEHIIDTIKSGRIVPGEKIESENELADRFGISRHTVRQAIGELVSEGWLSRAQGRGTFVNRHHDEKRGRTGTVGVVTTYLNDYIFPSIIRGIDKVLSENGYNMLLSCTYNMHEKERLCLENIKSKDIDGLIVEATKSALPNPNLSLYKELSDIGIPVIFIHGCYKELNCSYIVEDDAMAGYLAAKHLIDLGHSKIGGIFKMDDMQGHYRFAGFQKAHLESGLTMADSRVLWFDTGKADKLFEGGDADFLENILSVCTSIVFYNDQVALKAMDVIRSKGLDIPDDISIVSFDDSQLAVASQVKLTTVAHPKEKLGEEAAGAIINMINGTRNYYDIKMQPELIIRGSTRKLNER